MKHLFVIIALALLASCSNSNSNKLGLAPLDDEPTPLVYLTAKVYLSGCYIATTSTMHDSLRVKNLVPIISPYDFITTTSNSVLAVTGNDAIVDWVLLTIGTNNYSMLLQRDGDIVDVDGYARLAFDLPFDSYNVTIKHRNHLGVQTASAIALNDTSKDIDFTSMSTPLFTNQSYSPTKIIAGKRALYAGNCNDNNFVSYTPLANSDRTALFNYTGAVSTIFGYNNFDVNMDGKAQFISDRLVILNTCNNSNTTIITEQLY